MMTATRKTLTFTALTISAALALTACGGSSDAQSSESPAAQPQRSMPAQPPGANGKIASVAGSTMQVQSDSAQTEVTYASSTAFTQTKSLALSSVAVGDCVTANGEASGNSVTATVVNVSAPVNGECEAGFPGGRGDGGGGRPTGMPTDFPGGGTPPSGFPSGGPGGAGGAGFTMASGKVTSVTAGGLVVSGQLVTMGSGQPSSTSGDVTVTLASDGQVMKEVSATSSAIAVGQCARAIGEADDKGAIAATSINISAPANGECRSFGGFGGGRPSS